MAATVDNRPTSSNADAGQYGVQFMLEASVDFTVTANQLAQNETMALFDLPADTIVTQAFIEVETVDSDITDVDLGCSTDGSTAADLIDGATLAATGYVTNGTYLPAGYDAAQQVVLTNKDADTLNGAKIRVVLICFDASDRSA